MRMQPNDDDLLYRLGMCCVRMKEFTLAQEAFSCAIRFDLFFFGCCWCKCSLKNLFLVLVLVVTPLRLLPSFFLSFFLKYLHRAFLLRLNPNFAAAYHQRGACRLRSLDSGGLNDLNRVG